MDLDIIPCIPMHKHTWNAHRVCQWCNNDKDHIELMASRLRIKELEDGIKKHKRFVLANYDEPDCSISENLVLWSMVVETV
jgi:hypothetical protein